ncbi:MULTISPECIES: hypothetical protein [Lysobacteraceae]|nr:MULTISPECIES: hypothetical protein [Lysobacter]
MTPTVKSDRFGVVSSSTKCHACGEWTPVKALLVRGGQWRNEPDDEDDYWYPIEGAGLLLYVQDVNAEALAIWRNAAPWVRNTPSRTAGISYWSNTCVHCEALQGDWFLTKPDGPFFPTTPELEAKVALDWADGSIEAVANVNEASWLDGLAERMV